MAVKTVLLSSLLLLVVVLPPLNMDAIDEFGFNLDNISEFISPSDAITATKASCNLCFSKFELSSFGSCDISLSSLDLNLKKKEIQKH